MLFELAGVTTRSDQKTLTRILRLYPGWDPEYERAFLLPGMAFLLCTWAAIDALFTRGAVRNERLRFGAFEIIDAFDGISDNGYKILAGVQEGTQVPLVSLALCGDPVRYTVVSGCPTILDLVTDEVVDELPRFETVTVSVNLSAEFLRWLGVLGVRCKPVEPECLPPTPTSSS